MRPTVVLVVFLAIVIGVTSWATAYTNNRHLASTTPIATEPGQPRVKLAVLVVFDQMRGDFLENWRGLFGPDGFARLQTEGAWFTHCNYPYATTTTGPGHASMLSGTSADRHGIINNNWFEGGGVVYCAGSTRYELVPPPPRVAPDPKASTKGRPKEIGSPDRLLAETVADVLRARHPAAKIFGLSLKDRSAILPVGKRPSGAYWFVDGRFVTSTYYAESIHPWVEKMNSATATGNLGGANKWFGKDWTPGRPDLDYFDWLDPVVAKRRNAPMSHENHEELAFRHANTGGKTKPGREYYEQLATSSFGNDLLLELAKSCAIAEDLGRHAEPDLLVVSFSSNDLIGHKWGPDSPEVLDVTLHSDAIMAELLTFLDHRVGKGQYLMAVTADHGICPVVEVSRERGIGDAERVNLKVMQEALEAHLTARFGSSADTKEGAKKRGWIEAFAEPNVFPWLYFNPKMLTASGRTQEEVAHATVEFLTNRSQVARAFTRSDLAAGFPASDVLGNRVRRSYYPERAGDVYVLLKPYYLPSEGLSTGTTHGSPYNYDTHVPLLVYGPGIVGGVKTEPVTPQATAAIVSKWLGLPPPNKADVQVPVSLGGE
jgi:predicted AlkP superfamily pyrophosphatase or phosphodiesterase